MSKKAKKMEKNLSFDPPFPLSKDWRVRRSSIEEVELKYVQESVQSFVDVLVGKGYRVIWKGQDNLPGYTRLDKPLIYISHGPILGEAPADPKRVDVVAGIGVHEAGHTKLANVRGRTDIDMVGNILEDCWIDYNTVSDFPVLGAYIQRTRDYYKRNVDTLTEERLKHPQPLSRNEVVALWMYLALYEVDVYDMLAWRTERDTPFINEALTSLITISVEGIKTLHKDSRTYQKLYNSAIRALEVYEKKVQPLLDEWRQNHPQQSQQQGEGDGGEAGEWGEPGDDFGDFGEDFEDDFGGHSGRGEKPTRSDDEEEDEEEGAGLGGDEMPDPPQPLDADFPKVGQHEGHDHGEEEGEEERSSAADASWPDKQEGEEDGEGEDGDDAAPSLGGKPSGERGEDTDMHTHLPMGSTAKANVDGSEAAEIDELKPSTCMDEMLKEMPQELAQKVWEAQEHEAEDVSSIAGSKFVMLKPGKTKPFTVNSRHAEAVKQAFETRRHLNATCYPFQEQGRLSHRTLPRIWMDATDLFEEELIEDEIDVVLGLLLDASGSIGTGGSYRNNPVTGAWEYQLGRSQWEMIMESSQMMVDAFNEGQLDLLIMSYTTGVVHRLYEPGWDSMRTQDVHPSGGTPSVSGIKVLAHRMEKLAGHRRDKMIIHMTDGEPNTGGGPDAMRQTVESLERKGMDVIGIGVGVPPAALERQYKRFFSIENFEEVPQKLQTILEKMG
jgi:hypothetical protein